MDFNRIKLIIWDLDDTFWDGTISESEVSPISENIQLVKDLTDCGIINSICSKNTYDVCKKRLEELDIFDYFVFSSIEWTPKGQRIKSIIKNVSLRAENVLFIDDNTTNLGEIQYYLPELMLADPIIIPEIIDFISQKDKTDIEHKRLKQYKILETKFNEQKKYDSNEDFLFASNIQVCISDNCNSELKRIYELIQRTNQLNYTKKRISIEELQKLIADKDNKCRYVTVKDKYGDYGIVGFYALKGNSLEHFLFSCRTIGLGVEQYVYAYLDFPELIVKGEVVAMVQKNILPAWINQLTQQAEIKNNETDTRVNDVAILIKGPCDLSKSMTYIKNSDKFVYEFTYVNENKGNTIEGHNHSLSIVGIKEYTDKQKDMLSDECIFIDRKMYDGSIFNTKYDIIFLSTLIEANYGVYQRKGTGEKVVFGSYLTPLSCKKNWDDYINQKLYTAGNQFTEKYLREFSEKYEFLGITQPLEYIERLQFILNNIDKSTTLCLLLGVEFHCEKSLDYDFKGRHTTHKKINDAVREFAKNNSQVMLLDLNEIVKNQNDFTNNINHYTSRIYYEIAQEIIDIINKRTGKDIEHYSSKMILFDNLMGTIKSILKKILKKDSVLYQFIYKYYKKIARKK